MRHKSAEQLPSTLNSESEVLGLKLQSNCRNNIAESQSQLAFQAFFAKSLFPLNDSNELNNQELCEKIEKYIANIKHAVFWKQLELLIPSKSHPAKRLLQQVFSKCMFKEHIAYEHKLALREMMTQIPEASRCG
ncbi:Hypothetical_protein [Hexamita inflata]|uniref:Hypothetical_protein n=1 Tax=Hexamita inflata TaxID=28002 RepID=A0AA86NW17_9EUKA|nr:Hypothetical protein HINF_LOCUS14905 [Hexamita inflata]CAI9927263.1 Hypothetical protein HINF_LOCUS14908 [Hexamita inflata]